MNQYKITYKSWFKRSDYINADFYFSDDGFISFKLNDCIIASISMKQISCVVRMVKVIKTNE